MKLTKLADRRLVQDKAVPGLLSCHLDYELKSGQGSLEYVGPKFDPLMWHQVLSFFRWTHKEMASESQVRLYVNTPLGRWGAWAFPQEARTGMSAREIAGPESPESAVARFASWGAEPSGDWRYFGTVHHHCDASAFQSGTDEANERNQDGLHLTVGKLAADRHDLHARFYLNEHCFEPDLSMFWPIDPALAEQVPPALHDALARFQMGGKVVVDFPEAWRQNIVEVLAQGHSWEDHRLGSLQLGSSLDEWPGSRQLNLPVWVRTEQALRELTNRFAASSLAEEDLVAALQTAAEDPAASLILEACLKHAVSPEELLGELQIYDPGF